ncbi:hypothetical protein [Flagellimonas sp.]|uniref:hypothetical protein n=1 Tax=Flagellimonas sp. TaxID=2058762 RepID=UPI003F4A1BE3
MTSCNNDDDTNDDMNAQCEGTVCTAIFIRINVSVTDMNQNPVALDSFTVTDLGSGNDMTIALSAQELAEAQQTGLYPLTQDGVLDLNEARRIQFRGFVNDEEVVSGDYTVSTDCCHVGLDSGDLELSF